MGVRWMSRGGSLSSALKGMVVGLPLPICSCGLIPIYRTLVVRGAPVAAAMAFLVATPELGLDAILLSVSNPRRYGHETGSGESLPMNFLPSLPSLPLWSSKATQ